MKNQFSKLNRYELVSIISCLMKENDALRDQLQQAQEEAASNREVDRGLLERICGALDRIDGGEAIEEAEHEAD